MEASTRKITRSFLILHEPALKTLASFQEVEVKRLHAMTQFDELYYSTQAMQPKSQFRSGTSAHKATAPKSSAAQFDELNYFTQAMQPKSKFSSGTSAHKASTPRSAAARFEELDYSTQAMQPKS